MQTEFVTKNNCEIISAVMCHVKSSGLISRWPTPLMSFLNLPQEILASAWICGLWANRNGPRGPQKKGHTPPFWLIRGNRPDQRRLISQRIFGSSHKGRGQLGRTDHAVIRQQETSNSVKLGTRNPKSPLSSLFFTFGKKIQPKNPFNTIV